MLQNIIKSYKKYYKLKFVTLFIILLLCSCAKKEPSTVLTDATSKEILQLQKDIEKSTCKNKDVFISRLNSINTEVKSINEMCLLRNAELKQENSKLKWIIGFMTVLVVVFIVLITKNHKIL